MKWFLCKNKSEKKSLLNIKKEASKISKDIIKNPDKYEYYLSEDQLEIIKNLNSVQKHALRQQVKIGVTDNSTPKMEKYLKKQLYKIKKKPGDILEDQQMIDYVKSNKTVFVKKIMSSEMKTAEDKTVSNSFFGFLKSLWEDIVPMVNTVLRILVDVGTANLKIAAKKYIVKEHHDSINKAIDHIGNKINLVNNDSKNDSKKSHIEKLQNIEESKQSESNNTKYDLQDVNIIGEGV